MMSSLWLALRSLVAAAALPGIIAGYVPWRYLGLAAARIDWRSPPQLLGIVLVALGVGLLGVCIWEFAHRGRGTLAPVDPPQRLVVQGLYRFVRNPMYVSVTTILVGELLIAQTTALLLYCAGWFVAVNLFVIGYEEPVLRHKFGASYERYTESVGRWIPRLRRGDDAKRS
jgi:protein-S-isoprenylcysteine O-methyltransferase Ste14